MFGAMFAYRPERAASELLRVTRPGGRVANGELDAGGIHREHAARAHRGGAAAGGRAELAGMGRGGRGDEALRQRGELADRDEANTGAALPAAPEAVPELFATCYGPTVATLHAADPSGSSRLRDQLTRLSRTTTSPVTGPPLVAGEYLDVQALVA